VEADNPLDVDSNGFNNAVRLCSGIRGKVCYFFAYKYHGSFLE